MELTIEQALKQAVEAHKEGKIQDADRLYTAILKTQPKHPDANHNLGVLAISVGKSNEALPFLKAALEANPSVAQFWLSYIDALIKLDRLTDAKAMLDQAKNKGAKGDSFDKLEKRINEADPGDTSNITFCQTLERQQRRFLDKAIQLKENGEFKQAIQLLQEEINQLPEDVDILVLLSQCYLLADQPEDAERYLNNARKIAPDTASVGWNTARLMLKMKKPSEALSVARATSQKFPDDVEGMCVLGACLRANGKVTESLDFLNKAIQLDPNYAEALINRGLIRLSQENKSDALVDLELSHRLKPHIKQIWDLVVGLKLELKEYSEAIVILMKMIEIDPANEKLIVNLALCHQHLKDFGSAIEAYRKALAIKPDFVEVHINLGSALKKQGKLPEAIEAYNKALSIKPDYAEAHFNIGNVLKEQGKLTEAIGAYRKALDIKPDYAEAYYNLGVTLQGQFKLTEAIEAYKKTLSIKSNFVEAYNNIGIALKDQGNLDEALRAYKKAIALKLDYADAYNNMGVALNEKGKLEEAIQAYNKALDIKPHYADAYNNMGNTLKEQGKLEEAVKAYNKALSIKPDYAEAHRHLSLMTNYNSETTQIKEVKALLHRVDLNDSDRCKLLYANAKMQEDLGDLSAAFDSYVAGGRLRKKLLGYEFHQDEDLFDQIKETALHFKDIELNLIGKPIKNTPIFILGMPRSGTTLVEQIISSHSEVTGGGELEFVRKFGTEIIAGLITCDLAAVSTFRERYLAELTKRADGHAFVTDKMPQNFRYIALICKAFPEAKIIHVKRTPEATCWSNFKHYFASQGLGYSYNLNNTVKYYGLYKDLMHVWYQSYNDRIYNLDYDKLTENQELETRRLVAYLGLNWENACLAPEENKRSVRTASNQQVRQKVYTGSSQAWRKYEGFIGAAFDGLH